MSVTSCFDDDDNNHAFFTFVYLFLSLLDVIDENILRIITLYYIEQPMNNMLAIIIIISVDK